MCVFLRDDIKLESDFILNLWVQDSAEIWKAKKRYSEKGYDKHTYDINEQGREHY